MSTDIKLIKTQLSKIVKSGGFLGKTWVNMIDNIGKKVLTDLAVLLAKNVLWKLATKATLSVLDKFERKINAQGVVRAGQVFTSNDSFQMKIWMILKS